MDRKKFIKTSMLAISGFYFLQSDLFRAAERRTTTIKETVDAPIIIIGSGYGGAVSALRLCEAGKK
ncbi:hypothetical protein [Chryseobacterium capnotolerans]|nr:hypothetical protein [Chryseobacterium capnotolerans]